MLRDMLEWASSLSMLALAALLLLAATLGTAVGLRMVLRARHAVWHLTDAQRRRRVWKAHLIGTLLALVMGSLAGWLGSRLAGIPLAVGVPVAIIPALFAARYVAKAFSRYIAMGQALLGGRPTEVEGTAALGTAPNARGRRIVILCDGTANRPPDAKDPAATNIWKIKQALFDDETQTVWYDAGVGTGTSRVARAAAALERWSGHLALGPVSKLLGVAGQLRQVMEAMTGTGVGENVLEGYVEIARQYRPGDRIYILGFSRGAYTARAIAGAISSCGLLKSSNLRYAPALIALYRARRRRGTVVPVQDEFVWRPVPIEMIGVFDTVASLGAPLWGWWFNRPGVSHRALNTSPVPICRHVYHALAMDERRATFFPTLFWKEGGTRAGWTETLEQVWFRGAHADIGGGYAETGISDITLAWMLERAERHGLAVKPEAIAALKPDPLARLHDETAKRPSWSWLGTWPRWAKVLDDKPTAGAGIAIHESVFTRAQAVLAATGRHELHDLLPGQPVVIRAEAQRQWDRTGLIIRGGKGTTEHYRIRWLGGAWRDSQCPPCGPAGDPTGEHKGDPRWRARRRRRFKDARWMTLCATIAGPRRWPLRELPLRIGLAYLWKRDPRLLLNQIAPIGQSLGRTGDSLTIRSERPPGMLYLFANDLWQTYWNNTGELELEVTRLSGPPDPGEPVWVLPAEGRWRLETA